MKYLTNFTDPTVYIPLAIGLVIIIAIIWYRNRKKMVYSDETDTDNETEKQEKRPFYKRLFSKDTPPTPSEPAKLESQTTDIEKKQAEGTEVTAPAKSPKPAKKFKMPKPSLVYVLDSDTRQESFVDFSGDKLLPIKEKFKTLGRKWFVDGKSVYAFEKNIDGEYKPIFVPQTIENPPTRLFRALIHPELAFIVVTQLGKPFLQKYGIYLLFAGAAMFFMWTALVGK